MKRTALFLILFLCSVCFKIWAQDSLSVKDQKLAFLHETHNQKWSIKVPVWVPGFTGSFAYGGIVLYPETGDYDFIDRLNGELGVTFYLIGDVTFTPKNWLFAIDGFHTSLASNLTFENVDRVKFLVDIDGTIVRGVAGYKVFETANEETYFKFKIYPYLGLRYINLNIYSVKLDYLDIRPNWLEPIVGIRANLDYKRWFFLAKGDVGGFGINEHSSWYAGFHANYRFSKLFSLGAGYNFLDFKYSGQFETKFLDLGIRLAGPVLNLEFHF